MVRQWLSGLRFGPSCSQEGSRPRPSHRRRRAGRGRRAWVLEGLEGRVLLSGSPTVYTVNLTSASGAGTGASGDLIYVIGQANANANTAGSLIEFDPTVFASQQTIALSSTLALSETAGPEVIDGPGASLVTVSGGGKVGVLSVASGVTATLSGLTISGGSTGTNGGGILNSGSLTLSDSTLTGNTAANMGGAVANLGTATITDSALSSNTASLGGGIENSSGTLTVAGSLIVQDSAQNNGGGIEEDGGTITVLDSAIEDDAAANGGGGLNIASGTGTIAGSTVGYNAAGDGAGIASAATLSITNSTLADNQATTAGGGIDTTGTLSAVNVTIADNAVGSSGTGGGLQAAGGTATLDNTIVAANTVGTGSSASDIALSGGGTVSASSAYNLIGTGGSGGLTAGTDGNQVNVANPGLGAPGDNGGTTLTIALLQGSPAIDAGSASISGVTVPTTDQRGALRGPAGLNAGSTVDIGAYEASSSFLVTGAVDSLDAGTLPTAVEWANFSSNTNPANVSSPAPNTIVFDTSGAFATAQTITLSTAAGTLPLTNKTTAEAIEGPGEGLLTIAGGDAVQVVSVSSGVTATLTGLTISGGSAISGGGIVNAGTLTVTDSAITNNLASSSGAGIDNTGTMTIVDVAVTRNTALVSDGGGIDNTGTMTIDGSTISGNSVLDNDQGSPGDGGGIANGGTLTIYNSTIASNSASGGNGAGLANQAGATAINDSTIANNEDSSGDGGGLDAAAGAVTLTDTTIAGNTAGRGGGIANDQTATLTAISATIADNVANSGGGLYVDGGSASLYNSIVAMNTADDIATNGGAVSSSSAYNLIGTGGSGGLTQGSNGNQVGVADPALGSLASNGGSTQTIAVLPGSPAIGGGNGTISGITIPATDQRGVARPAGSFDIGAFQDRGFTITVVAGGSPQSAKVDTALADPLTVSVASPSGDPVQGGIVTYTAKGTGASAILSAGTATIGASGQAQVTAAANGQTGSYTVTASALGATSTASFSLTNDPTVTPVVEATVVGINVVWGSQTAALLIPSAADGLLLPSGRHTDIPWLGINVLQITLSQAEPLTISNITLRSARGIKYQAAGVSANGTSYVVFLSRSLTAADRITLTIGGAGITAFSGQLNILPGDYNDNGAVNRQDYYDVRAQKLGLGPASASTFADINGDGVVNSRDVNLVRQRLGLKLPRQTAAVRAPAVEARPRSIPAVGGDRDHPGDFRREARFGRR